jgi:hypothetical protein
MMAIALAAMACGSRAPAPGPDAGVADGGVAGGDGGGADGGVVTDGGSGCRSASDCPQLQSCLAPGELGGCGACLVPEPTCARDEECAPLGDGFICDSRPEDCFCSGEKTCRAGCARDAECGEAAFCAPTHRCVPLVCRTDDGCPQHYECRPPDNPHCYRKICPRDADCPGGFCVNGLCYPALGTCTPPRA